MSNAAILERFGAMDAPPDAAMSPSNGHAARWTDLGQPKVRYVDTGEWDRLAARCSDAVSEQTCVFMESRWGGHRVERAVVESGGEFIGGAVVIVLRYPGIDRGLAVVKWGPLWREKGRPADPARLRTTLAALKDEYVDRRGCFLSVQPHADPDHGNEMVAALRALEFTSGSSLPYPDRYLVDVSMPPEDVRASLDQKWRYNLKKSDKNNLEIRLVDAEQGYPIFMELYGKMLDRKQFQDSSAIGTLADLAGSSEQALKPVFVLVYHDGRPTAGAVLDVAGDRAVYLYGATDDRALRLRAGYAMHWWIAEWLCARDEVRWYDLGGSDGDDGLHQFKKGFCGKAGRIVATPPVFNRSRSMLDDLMGRSIYAARDVKSAASRILHRARVQISA